MQGGCRVRIVGGLVSEEGVRGVLTVQGGVRGGCRMQGG